MNCKLGLFQDADFVGYLTESKSTFGGMLLKFGDIIHLHNFQRHVSNKRQCHTASTEAEVISLNTGLRMEGLFVLTLWDLVTDV